LPEHHYKETPERARLASILDSLLHQAMEVALASPDGQVQHRFRNVAQGVANQRSLLELDWEFADREGAQPAD
jgi:hypothetical protein